MKKATALLIAAAIVASMTGCGGGDDTDTSNSGNGGTTVATTNANDNNGTTEATNDDGNDETTDENDNNGGTEPEPSDETYAVGDTATIDNWEVTLVSFELTNRIPSTRNRYFEADDGEQYLEIVLTVSNEDSQPRTFYNRFGRHVDAEVVYNDSITFNFINLLGYDECLDHEVVNPLTTKTGALVFSVAERAANSDDSLVLRLYKGREEIIFELR
jgi:hypothetical protein